MSWQQDLPGPDEIEYSSWPRETDLSAYSRATDEILDLIARTTSNASVYQVGGVRAPGISDLDFVIVLNEPDAKVSLDRWGALAASLSPQTRYIVDTKPLMVSPELWRALPTLHDLSDFRHLAGPVLDVPPSADASGAFSHLFGEMERRLFVSQKLERYILKRSVHVRTALKRLPKVRTQAKVLAEFGMEKAAWSQFSDAASQLRRDWFALDRTAQIKTLYELILASAEIDSDLILGISQIAVEAGLRLGESPGYDGAVTGAFDLGKVFVEDYQPDFRLKVMAASYRISGELVSVLPATFMLPALIYSSHSPILRDIFDARLTIFGDRPDTSTWRLQPGIVSRIRVLERYLAFIQDHGYGWALFFNMWNFPERGTEQCQRYWREGRGYPRRGTDILPFLLRKRLEPSLPVVAQLVGRGTAKGYMWALRIRERIRPAARLLVRVIGRVRGTHPAASSSTKSRP